MIDFENLEKKVPFEILDIFPYNNSLYFVSGFSDSIGMISNEGYYLKTI